MLVPLLLVLLLQIVGAAGNGCDVTVAAILRSVLNMMKAST
jgi:hypothetical protein